MNNMRIVIDAYTCKINGVDPVQYRKSLMNSEPFRRAEIGICNDGSSYGGYSKCGALSGIEFFGESIDENLISALAQKLFEEQKSVK